MYYRALDLASSEYCRIMLRFIFTISIACHADYVCMIQNANNILWVVVVVVSACLKDISESGRLSATNAKYSI